MLTLEITDLNLHLMSDAMKIRVGRVSKLPIEKEEDIEDVGYTIIKRWKEFIDMDLNW